MGESGDREIRYGEWGRKGRKGRNDKEC